MSHDFFNFFIIIYLIMIPYPKDSTLFQIERINCVYFVSEVKRKKIFKGTTTY